MTPTEEFHAYPGPQLLTARARPGRCERRTGDCDPLSAASPAPCSRALSVNTRPIGTQHEDGEANNGRRVAAIAWSQRGCNRPYFEVLIVTGAPATRWPALAAEWRRLRRRLDAFIYEPVFVGSFEDAFCAAMLNPDIAAVIIHEGFPFRSRHDAPILRSLAEVATQTRARGRQPCIWHKC